MKKSNKRRRKPAHISNKEAMRRLRAMVGRIEKDVRIAQVAEAVLERGNDLIRKDPTARYPGAASYDAIARSLSLNLALTLARLFDQGSKRYADNKKDLASIPLMIRLLRQRRCQEHLIRDARNWTTHIPRLSDRNAEACGRAIEKAIVAYKNLVGTPHSRAMPHRLKRFRNQVLAHSMMFETLKTLPKYADLFHLLAVAAEVLEGALFAVEGKHRDASDFREAYNDSADQFWRFALRSSSSVDPGDPPSE
jgi:hypothetical protein